MLRQQDQDLLQRSSSAEARHDVARVGTHVPGAFCSVSSITVTASHAPAFAQFLRFCSTFFSTQGKLNLGHVQQLLFYCKSLKFVQKFGACVANVVIHRSSPCVDFCVSAQMHDC